MKINRNDVETQKTKTNKNVQFKREEQNLIQNINKN